MIWIWFIWSWTFHWINTEYTLSLMKTKIFRLFSSQQLILWLKRHILCHFRLLFSATGPRIMNTYSKMASALILYYSLGVQIINYTQYGIIFRWKWPILVKFWTQIHVFKLEMYQNSFLAENVYFSKNSLPRVKILKSILRRLTPGFWKFSNRSYSRVYRYIRQCVYICFRYLDGGRWLSINLYLW